MKPDLNHPLEPARLEGLRACAILDSPPEEAFDELAGFAARICGKAAGMIGFIDAGRHWMKSAAGWDQGEIPRCESICAHAILEEGLFEIEDLSRDERFPEFPAVREGFRFYAGVPLRVARQPEGQPLPIGSLCVLDREPGRLTDDQRSALRTLARQAEAHLELRRGLAESQRQHDATEEALRHSEAFYHSLVEAIPQNIFRKDRQGRFTFANSSFCKALGKSFEEIAGRTDFDLFPPELALKYQRDDRRVLDQKTALKTIEEHTGPGGKRLWVQVIKTPLFDAGGGIAGIQGIFWDETERFEAEEALAHERDLLRSMLDNIPDSIYFKDRESRFVAISKAVATRLGLQSPMEALGKSDQDYFAPEHALGALEDERRIMRTGQPLVGKIEREVWLNGEERWVFTTKVPLRNPRGEITGTFGISRDITEIKRTEAELAAARDIALESARLKSEFLANMSHEIRTPLNAVIGMSGLLMDTPLNPEQRDFAETIHSSAEALLNIINDILDFSKIEAGKLAVELIDFNLAEVVEGSAGLLAEPAQAKGLELASWIEEDVPKQLRGDPGRIRQVLTNLLANAVKFTERGEVVLTVVREHETESAAVLRFSVRDTGIGIAADAMPRLFEAFVQADGSTTRRFGGTGLGLAISRQLVELMHGEIGVESAPGEGSAFWFRLPLEKQPLQASARPITRTTEGVRVLVVDDNPTNRRIIHRQVTSWRMRNGCAENAPEALRMLQAAADEGDPYQVILLDMQMPGMDGLALAREIASRPGLSSPRLVMLTSMGHLQAEKQWRECGVSAYLIKPVKEARLYDAILTVLRGHAGPVEHPRGGPACAPSSPPAVSRILVAEDNVVNQKVALRQLQKLGFPADAVANGAEVLQALGSAPYDVILMDCQMPELDGFEAARRIRAGERAASSDRPVYIIAMTANALAGDRETCLRCGMDDYISKPVRVDELASALARAAEALRARAAEPGAGAIDPDALAELRQLQQPGEPSPVAEIATLFLDDAPRILARLEAAWRAADPQAAGQAAHTLKGSSSNLGLRGLARAALKILEICHRGELPSRETIQALQAEFDRARPELERIIESEK